MNIRRLLAGIAACLSLAACQTPHQKQILLTKETLPVQKSRVAVAVRAAAPDLYLPGAGCLLCMAAATLANSSLNTYAKTLKPDELLEVKGELVELMRKQGIDAVAVEGQPDLDKLPALKLGPNMATKDYRALAKDADYLVVVNVQQLGFVRNYSAYIPTGDPRATLQGAMFMVNLKTNAYEWYDTLQLTRSADGKWDEAPAFPGLTNAYFQAIEQAKDRLKAPFVPAPVAQSQ